jgi:NAD(P)-dependent dehydrogenase (short-subunit alcohol dehydrogenase family)
MEYKRSVLVTGGTINMGYHAALALARKHPDWLVVVSSRSDPNKAADTINKTLSQKNVVYLPLDLSSSSNIRTFAKTWESKSYPPIQALVLNAALQFPGATSKTAEGLESTFAITHVGHAHLFHLLAPHLAQNARVAITASGTHDPALNTGMPKTTYTTAEEAAHPPTIVQDGRNHYVNSKLANILWTYALQKRLDERAPERGIAVLALDPGLMPGSGLGRDYSTVQRFMWNKVLPRMLPVMRMMLPDVPMNTPAMSGAALARLASSEDVAGVKGKYFEGQKQRNSSVDSYDVAKQDDLWNWSIDWAAKDAGEKARFEKFE